jgi:thioredoxin reductase (NADPH)
MIIKNQVGIIGAGPAGIATAIQLKRQGMEPMLFEQGEPGGLIRNANLVENYMGFPKGITGIKLKELLKTHLGNYQIPIREQKVEALDYTEKEHTFYIHTPSQTYPMNQVVVASGTKPRRIHALKTIPKGLSNRILFEVYPLITSKEKNKKIVIVGAGDIAFDYALNLSKANEIILLNRGTEIKALSLLYQRIKKVSQILYQEHTQVLQIQKGRNKELQITLSKSNRNNKHTSQDIYNFINKNTNNKNNYQVNKEEYTNREEIIEADYLVCAVGREPQKDFYSEAVKEQEEDLISKGSLYLAGDVKNGNYRQVAISVGNGIEIAMRINQKLKEKSR